ncbi:MAG: peptidylprolyl isomerase [Gemmatimonadales bacterium]|nr:peptidylprolyl isomerase [Gemmatimonadales bacterium]
MAAAHAAGLRSACDLVTAATADPHPYVMLMAIDSAGAACNGTVADSAGRARARAMLARVIDAPRGGLPAHAWQAPAHALVTAAHFDAALARRYVDRFASAPRWQERMYAARAAAVLSDRPTLERLAADTDDNVRDAAIAGLSRTVSHSADSTYLAALTARGNQVVLTAAAALGGSADPRTVPAMLDALDRLTALRSENTRDPRFMLLRRIGELGAPRDSAPLLSYVADFDTTIADSSAALLSRWTGLAVAPRSVPLPVTAEPLADLFQRHDTRVRVMLTRASGGGSFVVRLFAGEAPATTARVLRLAREGYYSGAVLHRVEPNFVVQGGGPGATEYIGHQRFMRDELASRSHLRGTVGISSRGRDTGDAQWFINLADNIWLDHEYTVFGEIISGCAIAERILEGDTIARVEVIGAR